MDTPSDENSRSSQFNVTKGFRLQWPILVFIRINLWEEFVKVWHLQMAKMSQNMTGKFKITDFLLGFGFRSRRLFCRYCYVTCVYRFSYMYVKRSLRALRWMSIGGAVEPFCHTYFWNPYKTYISTSSDACAKFPDFSSMFRPSKMRLSLENNNNNNNSMFELV